jgi:hypothetical protein
MKELERVLTEFKTSAIDGRDAARLAKFVPEADLPRIDVTLKPEYVGQHKAQEWTRENVLTQLRKDVEFGFEKALNCRGISSSLMFEVVRMWNDILQEGLETWDENEYANYGLPLFKATALKYGFPNPIGDDTGDEDKYEEETYA